MIPAGAFRGLISVVISAASLFDDRARRRAGRAAQRLRAAFKRIRPRLHQLRARLARRAHHRRVHHRREMRYVDARRPVRVRRYREIVQHRVLRIIDAERLPRDLPSDARVRRVRIHIRAARQRRRQARRQAGHNAPSAISHQGVQDIFHGVFHDNFHS